MASPAASLPLKIAHVFLKRKNSLRSDSLRFYTENFPDFLNAAEKNAGSAIKHSFYRKEKNYRSRDIAKFKSIIGEA